jgi:adenylate cyclase
VNVELTEAATGVHVWSETYDAELKDICRAGRHRATRRRCSRCEAHPVRAGADSYEADRKPRGSRIRAAQARVLVACKPRKERRGCRAFPAAIDLDPKYAEAYAALGWSHFEAVVSGWTEFRQEELEQAEALAQKALALDPMTTSAYRLLAFINSYKRR